MTAPDPMVHAAAQQGFSREAAMYARGRPGYPPEIGAWLTATLGLGPGHCVADVGAGTGKFSALLAQTGARTLAIEPVGEMRAQCALLPGVETLSGTAQALPVAGNSLDAIVCAQAFHWFASADVLDEFARALRPGGVLGLVWNVRDESVDWVARITHLVTPYEGDAPRFHKGDWRRPFPHPRFSPLQETTLRHEHVGPPAQVIVERIMSVSFIAALPRQDNDHVRAQLEHLVATHRDLRGRDCVRFPYRTLACHCTRIG